VEVSAEPESPSGVPPYLVGLRLAGRRVAVIGGGRVAARRVPRLIEAGADVVLVSPVVSPVLEGLASSGRITWRAGTFVQADLDDAWYVLAATDDPTVNAAVAAAADQRRIFCVRADDAAASSAWTPAVADVPAGAGLPAARLAVSSGRPTDSVRMRDRIVSLLTSPLAEPTDTTSGVPDRRSQPRKALRPAGVQVALVGGGPGAPDLITVRGHRMLRAADVVVADRLAPTGLLHDLDDDVVVIDAAKLPRGRSMSQDDINAVLIEHALTGAFVVRLKGGDPFVLGRGFEELQACTAAGLLVEVVPGISSALAGPLLAGIPVTHRGLAQEFTVVSAHLPPGAMGSQVEWPAVARLRGTVVVLMGLANAAAVAAALIDGGRLPSTPVAVVVDASHPSAQTIRGVLADLGALAETVPRQAPGLLVIGDVAGLTTG
jgi:uroporphyrin-III C-methyltransferase/precorrin-2 dehydrogenase/sirohydrochlorin ferrochelatase